MKLFALVSILALAATASAETPAPAPANFVTQILEPTGGKIKRPNGWFYNEDHQKQSYTWLISRENPSKGKYTTGVRIQTLVGVRAVTGKTPREFVQFFLDAKKKAAAKVIKSCDEQNQGLFTRACLETEEGDDHFLYSAFWGNDNLDVVVISTAGTPKKSWNIYAATFDTMSNFELIDMNRFDKPAPGPVIPKAQLIGHWRFTDKEVTSDYTFKDDGSYTSNITQKGKVVWETEGKWSLDGKALNYELTKSSVEQVPAGTKDQDIIVEITKDYYVVLPGDGHERKFLRLP